MSGTHANPGATGLPVLVEADQIARCVDELAAAIAADHDTGEPLLIVAVLVGVVIFLADLVRRLPIPLEIDLVQARSYGGTERGERVELLGDVSAMDLAGRHVLLLDCVLDSGHTLSVVGDALAARGPASLKTCVLFSKDRAREYDLVPDYVGMTIPDVFVVGYGLDCDDCWRHLPYVAWLPADAQEETA